MANMNRKSLFLYFSALIICIALCFAVFKFLAPSTPVTNSSEYQDLTSLNTHEIAASPVKDSDTVIEIFAYGCHYCALNEDKINEIVERLPAGKSFVQLHLSSPGSSFSRTDTLFAALTVMGIEKKYREKIYHAINEEHIDLGTQAVRDMWLQKNNIDVAAYDKASTSEQARDLLNYMAKVTQYYKIRATPTFIVNKKWVALQDRKYPAFNDHLLSLVQHDQPLEK